MTLNARQSRFVAEYLKDLNATQAAVRSGYSGKTAESQGSRLLSNAKVAAEISAALARRAERVEVKADDVLRELLRLAMVDISEAFGADGQLKPLHEMSPDVRRAIAGVEVQTIGNEDEGLVRLHKVKFWDKTKSLELLGKHLKLFTEKLEVSGKLTLEQLVERAAKKP